MKRFVVALTFVLLLALAASAVVQAAGAGKTLYFLKHTMACPCTKKACQSAQPLADALPKQLVDGVTLVTSDFALAKDKTEALMKKYKIFAFPAFVLVDENDKVLYQVQGTFDNEDVLDKLTELGVVK
ncbi:MAG TPA: hypothetical protein PKW95_10020 [bacterium]|nr:hypothetical protein [bacterium]